MADVLDWGDPATQERVLADLLAAADAGEARPGPDGVYRWTIGGRRWEATVWTDRDGLVQTPVLPGIYRDERGHAHFNIPELCSIVELERTPDNLAAVADLMHRAAIAGGLRPAGRGLSDG